MFATQKKTAPNTIGSMSRRGRNLSHARLVAALLAVALWSGLSVRPVEAIEAPEHVEPYQLVRVKHRPDGWLLIDPIALTSGVEVDVAPTADPTVTVFVGPPGAYRVRELSIDAGRYMVNQVIVVIGPAPLPPNPPPIPPDPDPEPPTPEPIPDTQYKIGPVVARQWRAVLDTNERMAVAAIFRDTATGLLNRTIPTVQDAVTKITVALRPMNTNNRLSPGHTIYAKQMLLGFDEGRIRTVAQHAGAFREIADWLTKE